MTISSSTKGESKADVSVESTNRWIKIVKVGIFVCILLLIAAGSASTITINRINEALN
jgi:hypothetical protein